MNEERKKRGEIDNKSISVFAPYKIEWEKCAHRCVAVAYIYPLNTLTQRIFATITFLLRLLCKVYKVQCTHTHTRAPEKLQSDREVGILNVLKRRIEYKAVLVFSSSLKHKKSWCLSYTINMVFFLLHLQTNKITLTCICNTIRTLDALHTQFTSMKKIAKSYYLIYCYRLHSMILWFLIIEWNPNSFD